MNSLIVPHELYLKLGSSDDERHNNYRELFDTHIDARELTDIRNAANKSWVLGTDRFKESIEALTARQTKPKARGGDRKSKKYRETMGINRV